MDFLFRFVFLEDSNTKISESLEVTITVNVQVTKSKVIPVIIIHRICKFIRHTFPNRIVERHEVKINRIFYWSEKIQSPLLLLCKRKGVGTSISTTRRVHSSGWGRNRRGGTQRRYLQVVRVGRGRRSHSRPYPASTSEETVRSHKDTRDLFGRVRLAHQTGTPNRTVHRSTLAQ